MQNKMDFQKFCEFADKELALGLADERLIERSYREANGVESHARQLYWHLRATALQSMSEESPAEIVALQERIRIAEGRLRARKERNRWFWAVVCFSAAIGTVLFPYFAIGSMRRGGPTFYALTFMGVACLVLTIIAYTASRYHTETD